MESFYNIPVEIDGKPQEFNFEYLEESDAGRECTITSKGKILVVGGDFTVIKTTMPGNWVDPAITTLKNLLNTDQGLP
jgi:hypothetical protein